MYLYIKINYIMQNRKYLLQNFGSNMKKLYI